MFFAADGALLGLISVADPVKETSAAAIAALRKQGLRVVLLTGDSRAAAEHIGALVGVDEVIPEVLPEEKAVHVQKLEAAGRKVMMVGDGINDAPALTAATVGCAIGSGSDIAIEAADIVLMRSDLEDVPRALRLSALTLRDIKQKSVLGILLQYHRYPHRRRTAVRSGRAAALPHVRGRRHVFELRVRGGQRPAFGHREAVKRRKQWQRKQKLLLFPAAEGPGADRGGSPVAAAQPH